MDANDYCYLYNRIKDFFNVPDEILTAVPVPALAGSSDFYCTVGEACEHPFDLPTRRELYVGELLVHIAGFLNQPVTTLQEVSESVLGSLTERVVIAVDVPTNAIIEPGHLGTYVPHRTNQKISPYQVREVIHLK
jgi:hypothetical protein